MKFTFAPELIKEHIIYSLGQWFEEVTNILRADMDGDKRWVVLELQGRVDDIERGMASETGTGVGADPTVGAIVEG